ncbi:hypothetical protein [Paracoccus sp. MC1862]|uniref:hypothetical protein n=1 Tax=Paracoccus sp. MC1862 TaxID=2760307 RepID=UPI001F2CDDA7|nr:hypothetical protein [Paracoccus sp. MC1862]
MMLRRMGPRMIRQPDPHHRRDTGEVPDRGVGNIRQPVATGIVSVIRVQDARPLPHPAPSAKGRIGHLASRMDEGAIDGQSGHLCIFLLCSNILRASKRPDRARIRKQPSWLFSR